MDAVLYGDCLTSLRSLAALGVKAQMCVTSPPYFGLRSYLDDSHADKALEIGLEETPEQFIAALVEVFRAVRDVLADDGTLWVNIGDSYKPVNRGENAQPRRESSTSPVQAPHLHADLPTKKTQIVALRDAGYKEKDLLGIPWMLAFALRADGWYLRQDIIWHKPNPMPESVTDRCTKAHEYVFLLSKSLRYFYDHEAIKEPAVTVAASPKNNWGAKDYEVPGQKPQKRKARASVKRGGFNGKTEAMADTGQNAFRAVVGMRNRRSVWSVATRSYKGAHFATFPPALIEPCILAGSRPGDVVLDPFMGSGTTAATSKKLGRQYLGCELNAANAPLIAERLANA